MGPRLILCFSLMGFPLAGCSDVADSVPQTVVVHEGRPAMPSIGPIEGAELCETDTSNCSWTNQYGEATIGLPANQRVSWTMKKEGYGSNVVAVFTGPRVWTLWHLQLWTDEWYAENLSKLMTSYPMTDEGAVVVTLYNPFAGATFRLVDATGKTFYFDEEGSPSLTLEATTSLGMGGFVEIKPGTFQIEIGGIAKNCAAQAAWPGSEVDRIELPVLAGHTTIAVLNCPPPP